MACSKRAVPPGTMSSHLRPTTLEPALLAGIIAESAGRGGALQFTHSLVQRTMEAQLPISARVRLHARIAEALERLYLNNTDSHAAELAHHFAAAETVTGPDRLVRYSLIAGRRALAVYAYEDALAHFDRALEARGWHDGPGLPGAPAQGQQMDAEIAALLSGRGRACSALLRHREALACLSAAFDYYMELPDVPNAVATAEHLVLPDSGPVSVAERLTRVLAQLPPDSHDAGRLLCRYGIAIGREAGDYQRARDAFDRAVLIARREKDVALEMKSLMSAAEVGWWHMRTADTMRDGSRAFELARRVDDLPSEVAGRFFLARAMSFAGGSVGHRAHAAAMLPAAERLRDRFWLAQALFLNAESACLRGDWQVARDFFRRGLVLSPEDPRLLCMQAHAAFQEGKFAEGEAWHDRLLAVTRATPPGPVSAYT